MKNNRTSAINDVIIKKDVNNNVNDVNNVIDNNVVKDVIENDVIVEKVVNNDDDYDYGYDYWDNRREIICREREEERRIKYLRKSYNKTEVAKLKAIIDNKKNDDDFDFDNWVFESGKQVDIAEKAKKDLWDLYGIKYNGRPLDLKKFNSFMNNMDSLYCDVHGGLKQDCNKCNK